MTEWRKVKLGDVCEISAGGDRPQLVSDKETDICHVPIYSNGVDNDGLYGFTDKEKIKGNSITITARGANVGTVFYRKTAYYPIIRLLSLQPNEELVNSRYLYYLIKDKTFLSTGSAQPQITVPNISKYVIEYDPDVVVQRRIAEVLSRYDALIENYRRQIKLLEEAAQRLYKEWFVDLRFPGHQSTPIINNLPIGWEKRKIGDFARIKSGFAFKSKDWQTLGCPVVKIKDITGTFVSTNDLDCVPIEVARNASSFVLNKGDLVIAMTGATIGKIGLLTENGIYTNQRVGKFFMNDKYLLPFCYCFFKQETTAKMILQISSSSSAQPNISGGQLESFEFACNSKLINDFNLIMYPCFSQMIHLKSQINLLAEARDRLLPKLMSAEIEV